MPNPPRLRAAALTATVVLLSAVLRRGCGGDSKDEDLSAQKLSWKDCPAPSAAGGRRRRPLRPAERRHSGSAPP